MLNWNCAGSVFALLAAIAWFPNRMNGEEPYIAEGRLRILLVEAGGETTERRSFPMVEARDRSGNRYSAQERPQGKLVTLWLKQTGILYAIDYAQKTAHIMDRMQTPPGVRSGASASGASKQVAGLPCVPEAVFGLRDGKRVKTGESCFAVEPEGLRLSSSAVWTSEGRTLRNEMEIVDFRRGAEPDPNWFKVPEDFRIIEKPGR